MISLWIIDTFADLISQNFFTVFFRFYPLITPVLFRSLYHDQKTFCHSTFTREYVKLFYCEINVGSGRIPLAERICMQKRIDKEWCFRLATAGAHWNAVTFISDTKSLPRQSLRNIIKLRLVVFDCLGFGRRRSRKTTLGNIKRGLTFSREEYVGFAWTTVCTRCGYYS